MQARLLGKPFFGWSSTARDGCSLHWKPGRWEKRRPGASFVGCASRRWASTCATGSVHVVGGVHVESGVTGEGPAGTSREGDASPTLGKPSGWLGKHCAVDDGAAMGSRVAGAEGRPACSPVGCGSPALAKPSAGRGFGHRKGLCWRPFEALFPLCDHPPIGFVGPALAAVVGGCFLRPWKRVFCRLHSRGVYGQ